MVRKRSLYLRNGGPIPSQRTVLEAEEDTRQVVTLEVVEADST